MSVSQFKCGGQRRIYRSQSLLPPRTGSNWVLRLAGNALPYMLSHLAGPDVVDCAGIPASPFARGFSQTPVRAFPSRGPTVPVYSTAVNLNR